MNDDFLEDILDGLGVEDKDRTSEQKYYDDLTQEGKYKKIENCIYWFKHQLYVYNSLKEKNWIIARSNGPTRVQVTNKELGRFLLEYYFLMHALPKFQNERGAHNQLDMERFLDLVIEYPTIKKLIENPTLWV